MSPRPIAALAGVTPYAVPGARWPIDLRLDGSEGLLSPDIGPVELGPDLLRRYPKAGDLEQRLAERMGVDPAQVLVTAGADDALDRVCRSFLGPGRSLILPGPTFEMIGRYARLCGAEVIEPAWREQWPLDDVLDAIDERTSVVAAVSPNNPSGAVISPAALDVVAAAAPDALLLVDLAYGAFADVDLLPQVLRNTHAVAVGSLSKSWGLPALRVGWAVGHTALISILRAAGQPYAVSSPSLALAMAALERDPAFEIRHVAQVHLERAALRDLLAAGGLSPLPSQANFVFARSPDAAGLFGALARQGIAIRHWPGSPTLGDAVRITCPGEPVAFDRLSAALRDVLEITS